MALTEEQRTEAEKLGVQNVTLKLASGSTGYGRGGDGPRL